MAARLGADAVGMVFYSRAQTAIAEGDAREIVRALPPFVSRVALFVNPEGDEVRAAMEAARPHFLQFHGDETESFCKSFGVPYIKAFRVRDAEDVARAKVSHPDAAGILLDSFSERTPGGSGESFGWELARNFGERANDFGGRTDGGKCWARGRRLPSGGGGCFVRNFARQ